jgi:hypothetical protein
MGLPGREFLIRVVSRLVMTFPMALVWKRLGMGERLGMYGLSMVVMIRKSKSCRNGNHLKDNRSSFDETEPDQMRIVKAVMCDRAASPSEIANTLP